jgi:hypothetical protein
MKTVRKISSFEGADPFGGCVSTKCRSTGHFSSFVLLPDGVTMASSSGGKKGIIHLWQLDLQASQCRR